MPRLKKELVLEREIKAREFLKTMDVEEANKKLASEYGGMKMAPTRMMELKAEVTGITPVKEEVALAVEVEKVHFRLPVEQPSPHDEPNVKFEVERQRDAGVKFPMVFLD